MVVESEKFSPDCEDIWGVFNSMPHIDSRSIVGFYWVYRLSALIENKVLKGMEFRTYVLHKAESFLRS